MFERALTAITAGAIAILVVVINTTDPSTTGPTGILAVFFLLYVVFLGTFTWLVRGSALLLARVTRPLLARKPVETLSFKQSYYVSSVVAMAPIMLIGMSSVGQLGVTEAALVFVFVALGVFYVRKRT